MTQVTSLTQQLASHTSEISSLRAQLQLATESLMQARTSEAKALGEVDAMRETIKELKANNSWMMKLIATRFQGVGD